MSRWFQLLAATAALAAPGLCSRPARAADDMPLDIDANRHAPPFSIQRPSLVLELIGQYNSDSTRPKGGPKENEHDALVQEIVQLATSGYLVSPGFLSFNLAGGIGLQQLFETRQDRSDNTDGVIYQYDLNATLLSKTKAPLTVFATRSLGHTSQPFSETYETTTETYGALWTLRSAVIPTYFRIFHNTYTQDSLSGENNYSYDQDGAEWHTEALFSPHNRLNWNYAYNSISQTDSLNNNSSFDSNAATLTHLYEFGSKYQHSLTSSIDYFDQTGDFAQDHFRLNEDLLLRHTERFETFGSFQAEHNTFPGSDTTLYRGKTGVRHRFLESLVTTGTVGGLVLDQNNAGSNEVFANLDFLYTKKVPLGVLTGNLSLNADRQSNDAQSGDIPVEARFAFDNTQQVVIARTNILNNSVRLRDSAGTRVFTQGVDYVVQYLPDRAVIQRLPGGAIDANSRVLVDYDVTPQSGNDVTTDTVNAGLRYDFNNGLLRGLGVYTRALLQDQDISSDQPQSFTADNIQAFTFGSEYRVWHLFLSAEHETHHSDLSPFTADRFGVQYQERIGTDWRFNLNANHTRTHFTDTNDKNIVTTANGLLEYRPTRELVSTLSVTYLDMQDDIVGHNTGLEEQLEIKWNHRQTSVRGLLRHSDLDTDTLRSSFLYFQLSLERRF